MLLLLGIPCAMGFAVATYGARGFQDVFWCLLIGSTSWINVVNVRVSRSSAIERH